MQPIIDSNKRGKQFKFNFSKMNGAGNDFVVFQINNVKRMNGDEKEVSIEELVKVAPKISDRKFGIGCDQLIIVDDSPKSNEANYGMHVLNGDGSIEMMCGNGVRCATKYLLDNNIKSKTLEYDRNSGEELKIETKSGIIKTLVLKDHPNNNPYDCLLMVKVNMGKPSLVSTKLKDYNGQFLQHGVIPSKESFIYTMHLGLPYCEKIEFALIGCGGAHAIVFIERNIELGYLKTKEFTDTPLHLMNIKELADKIQENSLFLNDTIPNVEFVGIQSVQDKQNNILPSRVIERFTGETLACGTGACGVGIAALLLNYVNIKKDDDYINVQMPGGDLLIQWNSLTSDCYKIGPAQTSFYSDFLV